MILSTKLPITFAGHSGISRPVPRFGKPRQPAGILLMSWQAPFIERTK